MEFLFAIGLFSAKAAVIVIAFALIVLVILIAASKAQAFKHLMNIEKINDQYDLYEETVRSSVFTDDEFKEVKKQKKLEAKDKKKADKLAKKQKTAVASAPAPSSTSSTTTTTTTTSVLEESGKSKSRVYVLDFKGDVRAHAGQHLREEITAILTLARPIDEVLLRLESPGGVVHDYGFCASQLTRLRDAKIPLTIAVDKVAASGGYMMACVANKILCAPFAIVGSIGVVAQVPNFNRLLKKHEVDYNEYTAGAFKRTVSILGPITPEGEKKFKSELEETHVLFKTFVSMNRPSLDIEKIATGEHWYGLQGKDLGLIDEITTSDSYLLSKRKTHDLYKLSFKTKKNLSEKISEGFAESVTKIADHFMSRLTQK